MSKKKILIVDDDPDLRLGLHVWLKAQGYDTFFAADGMAAMSSARKEQPDLIILDLGLPAGDGFTVLNRLHSSTYLAVVPVIVLSARDAARNKPLALKAGASAYFQKPPDQAALLVTIRDLLGQTESAPAAPR